MKESLTNQAESCGELIQEQSNSAPLASKEQDWQLICPPRNWKDPLWIDLVITRGDKSKNNYFETECRISRLSCLYIYERTKS